MTRVYNFSAGPAVLPEPVLKKAASELVEYRNTGMSVMEMSHRSEDFELIINETENCLRSLMDIPENYKILFLQGGAYSQFSMIPLNLFHQSRRCDAIDTGAWTSKAIAEAKRYGTVNVLASSEDKNYTYIPGVDSSKFDPEADYFHICSNNTIYGTRFMNFPDTGNVPLVVDMSSNILSEKTDVKKCGLIFAGAQKNIGPAGLTIVIIREDLIGHEMEITPTMFKYSIHAENKSLFNTPPTYGIYMAMLVFQHLIGSGGIEETEKSNRYKAGLMYDFLDNSDLFSSPVNPEDRSLMNIPFSTGKEDLDADFIKQAEKNGLVALKGHRSTGGMRASIYNAMPVEGVEKLITFMKEFEKKYS